MKKYLLILLFSTIALVSCDNKTKPIKKQEDVSQEALQKKYLFLAKQTDTYKDAFIAITELHVKLDLTSKGIADSDGVINEYNDVIGKEFGFVDHVYEVKKQMKNKIDTDYLRAVQLREASKIALREIADINSLKK
jgi:hypothetical protein